MLPKAEEVISYGLPAFRVDGGIVAGLSATSKGCSYFPFSGSTLKTLASEVRAYSQTKSALHFTVDEPLPKALVRKLLKARMAEIKAQARPSLPHPSGDGEPPGDERRRQGPRGTWTTL